LDTNNQAAPVEPNSARISKDSYAAIVKSSSIIGGSTAVSLLMGMAAAKAGAIFLGPQGIGLLKLYGSTMDVLRVLSGLGISSSGVRELANAISRKDEAQVGKVVTVLKQLCWATGAFGWLITAVLAYPLSSWVFGSTDYATSLVTLGAALLFAALSGGQLAFLQGSRRIAALAKVNVLSAAISTILAIVLYWQLGTRGIVPALISGAAITLLISWWYTRKIPVPTAPVRERFSTSKEAKRLVGLGLAFMWSGLMVTSVAAVTNILIVRELGMEAAGFYGAAWALSGMFANFILGAMGADFLPRLAAVQNDHPTTCRLVNEQTEIGILLALPGLVATLFFAPLAIQLFYSSKFLVAAELLPWLVLGVFGRVTSWPMGFILIAKAKSKLFAATETFFAIIQLLLVWVGLFAFGLTGVAAAFCMLYLIYNIVMGVLTHNLVTLRWSTAVWRLIAISVCFTGTGFLLPTLLSNTQNYIAGGFCLILSSLFSLRGLAIRLGPQHVIARWAPNFLHRK
jgi:PST family polysaccharide transporter